VRFSSSLRSVKRGEPTWLACIETLLAIAAYWGIAIYWDTHLHLLLSICTAPLLLLRSPESTEAGARWFYDYWNNETEINLKETPLRFWAIILIACIISGAASYLFAEYFLTGHIGWPLFGRAFLLGILAFSIAVAVAGAGAVAGAFFVAPFAFGYWLRSLVTRILATLRYLGPGFKSLPDNWRHAILVIDFYHPPELVPGLNELRCGLSFHNIISKMRSGDTLDRIFYLTSLLIFFLPALLYRWSLKSTA
jgi:hypothetical protein